MKNLINLLLLASIVFISLIKAQTVQKFTSAGTQDQYVPIVFGFTYKPFSISRPEIHENRNWLAYGTATINGIGFGWGSGNTMIKLENFTHGLQNSDNTGNWYSYIGKVMCIWENTGILVYLRGGTTYYTDGNVIKNDGTDSSGKLSSVSITEPGFNIPRGIYVADWEINANTRSIDTTTTNTENIFSKNGNIGIGTSLPSTKLDVRGSISTPEIAFKNADGGDDSDAYRMRKVQSSSNNNWLELQLNDDVDESFRIYGNSCEGYNCAEYSGNLYHSFDTQGNVYHKGNVGIGTTNPQAKLDVSGVIQSSRANSEGGAINLYNPTKTGTNANTWSIYNMTGGYGNSLQFWSYSLDGSNSGAKLKISDNGDIAMYGKLEAREIKVTSTPTADFVFEDSYQLPNLESVEKHIKEKKHLPEIASAAEMQKEGVNIGDFQIKLLQKIEELTLYSIEQNKLNKEQSELLRQQIQINKTLEQRLQNLENNNQKN
ncbi:hypothetical protein HZQ11_18390 [Elizabethkingia anophelis]|nr:MULTISPECIES: hypothetical protein [Elizabethkingia]MCT3644369.1 hypothetical protein [Elizabethkingia anophelis]MCT3648843.1 hypothetical protein [Elizabethkingia anophelis]MCT3653632.1 hypothetical protein [Elizabethkingia anophelis]MCT3657260.1 hypothetical protein [Elizabethkingia anophelis]MCT3658141.1 hypothetical protein [Elizabethkingia anophelis]